MPMKGRVLRLCGLQTIRKKKVKFTIRKTKAFIVEPNKHLSFEPKPFFVCKEESSPSLGSICAETDVLIQNFTEMDLSSYGNAEFIPPNRLMNNE